MAKKDCLGKEELPPRGAATGSTKTKGGGAQLRGGTPRRRLKKDHRYLRKLGREKNKLSEEKIRTEEKKTGHFSGLSKISRLKQRKI